MNPTPTMRAGTTPGREPTLNRKLIDAPLLGLASVPTVCAVAWGMVTLRVNSDADIVSFSGERNVLLDVRAELKAWGLRISHRPGVWDRRASARQVPHWVLLSSKRRKHNVDHHSRHVWGTKHYLCAGPFVACCRTAVELITLEGSRG